MSEETQEIVVTGHRDKDGNVVSFSTGTSGGDTTQHTQEEVTGDGGGGTVGMAPISVTVSITNPANKDRAEAAAKKLIESIAQLIQKLEKEDPDKTFTFNGKTYRVGDLLYDLQNTNFTVTDRKDFQNNGVGRAERGTNGAPNTEMVNMDAILDGNGGGYGSQNYRYNGGMMAFLLHELGHISQLGKELFDESYALWAKEPIEIRGDDFYKTDYAPNLEAFANDFMNAAAGASAINLEGVQPGGHSGAVSPVQIYNRRTGS
jgi:hypothetical protein